jgi:hypothetical protein
VLKGATSRASRRSARETYVDATGTRTRFCHARRGRRLSVARGSLTIAEIDEIRSHVTHTFEFLSQIPWGKKFRRVAIIAGAHHER